MKLAIDNRQIAYCLLPIALSLLLFEARILFVDHVQPSFPPYDLAIGAAFFNGSSYLHDGGFFILC